MKSHKKMGYQSEEGEGATVLPPLNATEFSSKLDDLLNKVDIQNRYANRISHCNMKNLQQLDKAREELLRIAEEKKLKELRAGSERDLIEQIMRRVSTSEQELKNVFKELIDAKREIKGLKKELASLRKANLDLEKQALRIKRQKYFQVSVAKEEVENSLIATEVKTYLSTSLKIQSVLFQHCLQSFKRNNFTNFLIDLERKLEGPKFEEPIKHQKEKSFSIETRLKKAHSGIKTRILPKKESRIRTEVVENHRMEL